MKKNLFFLLLFLLSLLSFNLQGEEVSSLKVNDITEPYSSEFIISENQVNVNNSEELDENVIEESEIYGITSCHDEKNIRFDIFLRNSSSLEYKTWYGMVITYSNGKEYYIYLPADKEMYYLFDDLNGNTIKKEKINLNNDLDSAGIVGSTVEDEFLENSAVYLIINKDKHIEKTENSYTLNIAFESGYETEDGDFITVASTKGIDLLFNE